MNFNQPWIWEFSNNLWVSWLESCFLRRTLTLFQWKQLSHIRVLHVTAVRNKLPVLVLPRQLMPEFLTGHICCSLILLLCFFWLDVSTHIQKNSPSKEVLSSGRKCPHSHLQTVWMDVTTTWAHPNPPSTPESSALPWHPANPEHFLLDSHNKKLLGEFPEHFSILIFELHALLLWKQIFRNIYKSTRGHTVLLLVKLLQSDEMKPFSGTWPRQEVH